MYLGRTMTSPTPARRISESNPNVLDEDENAPDEPVVLLGGKRLREEEPKVEWRFSLSAISESTTKFHTFKGFTKLLYSQQFSLYEGDRPNEGEKDKLVGKVLPRPELRSTKDITRQNTMRIGPGIDEDTYDPNQDTLDTAIPLNPSTKQSNKYRLKNKSYKNIYLRRQLLIYLSKIETPIFDFISQLTVAHGPGSAVEDFIWVFPDDIETLSRKEPRLLAHQTYGPEDFVRELMMVLGTPQGTTDLAFKRILQILDNFLGTMDDLVFNTETTAPSSLSSSSTTNLVTPKKDPHRDVDHSPVQGAYSDESDSDETTDTPNRSAKKSRSTTSSTTTTTTTNQPQVEPRKLGFLTDKNLESWRTIFERIFRPEKASDLFYKNDENLHPLALLVLKPTVRGQMKFARNDLNVRIGRKYSLVQYIFSDEVSTQFAHYMAYISSVNFASMMGSNRASTPFPSSNIPYGIGGGFYGHASGGSGSSASIVNNYNHAATKYQLEYAEKYAKSAVEFFSNVWPAPPNAKVKPLPSSGTSLSELKHLERPLIYIPPPPRTSELPSRFNNIQDTLGYGGGGGYSRRIMPLDRTYRPATS